MKKAIIEPQVLANKSLGQNFLFDPETLRTIVDFSSVSAGDTVLEIGPGLGTLTRELLNRDTQVIAVEYDKHLAEKLARTKLVTAKAFQSRDSKSVVQPEKIQRKFSPRVTLSSDEMPDAIRIDSELSKDGERVSDEPSNDSREERRRSNDSMNDHDTLTIINADFLQFDLEKLPTDYHVVANIPYYITAKIIQKLLTAENKPRTVTLLVQREVAERLAAEPGDLSILAISAQVYSRVTLGPAVHKSMFTPQPKVNSRVVKMKLYDQSLIADIDEKGFFKLVKIGFSSPRKKVLKNIANGLHKNPDEIRAVFTELGIVENARAEDLTIETWKKLFKKLTN